VLRMRAVHPATWSQTHLNRRRYAQNDETLYVAPEDERTDYSQPPMANWYSGVLNTGKRRYGHPALNGVLPQPWLPLKKGQTLANRESAPQNGERNEAVVLTLRKRFSTIRRSSRRKSVNFPVPHDGEAQQEAYADQDPAAMDPWSETTANGTSPDERQQSRVLTHRLSFDGASGIIALPEDAHWMMEDVDTDSDEDYGTTPSPTNASEIDVTANPEAGNFVTSPTTQSSPKKTRHGTYYHHPERRRQTIPGAFPTS